MAKIMVVDDAAFMRMMLKDILTKGGHEVVGEAENGFVAVDKYKRLVPDLVTAKDFIVKPFNPERVLESINKALGL